MSVSKEIKIDDDDPDLGEGYGRVLYVVVGGIVGLLIGMYAGQPNFRHELSPAVRFFGGMVYGLLGGNELYLTRRWKANKWYYIPARFIVVFSSTAALTAGIGALLHVIPPRDIGHWTFVGTAVPMGILAWIGILRLFERAKRAVFGQPPD